MTTTPPNPWLPDPGRAPKKRAPWLLVAALAALGVVSTIVSMSAIAGADSRNQAATFTPAPTPTTAPVTAKPAATTPATSAPATTAPATTEPAEAEPAEPPEKAAKLSARQWKKIAKSPDDYIGKKYVIYGVVTQFDSATGGEMFRADVGPKNMSEAYDYDTNSMMSVIDLSLVDDLVEDDEFRAEAVVMGSQSYETAMGGEMTVPWLMVTAVKVI